ncbi:helix-turn-helix transcriptional regulator [Actinomadura viridis]|uniref:helix-turn-helix domain-containing protein n=1 Tax=Actinomadura viridis TaxID=58110 RepID=UPI0036950936
MPGRFRETPDPMVSMWTWLAHDLRFYRLKHGLSGERFGRIIGVVRSTVSRMEAGELKIDEEQAKALDTYFGTGGHFLRLLTYAKLGHNPDWQKEYENFEARATMIRNYGGQLVPALFQTPDYARALLTAGRWPDVEGALAARMARQRLITGPEPPDLWILLAESVLDWPVGGPEIMKEQLAHLLEVSEMPNVTLRAVPRSAGAHQGLDGPFKIIRVPERDVAFVEAPGGGRLIMGISEVQGFGVRFDRIAAEALSPGSSRTLIKKLMEGMS